MKAFVKSLLWRPSEKRKENMWSSSEVTERLEVKREGKVKMDELKKVRRWSWGAGSSRSELKRQ